MLGCPLAGRAGEPTDTKERVSLDKVVANVWRKGSRWRCRRQKEEKKKNGDEATTLLRCYLQVWNTLGNAVQQTGGGGGLLNARVMPITRKTH